MLAQVGNIRIAPQQPQKLVDHRAHVDLFGRDQWEALRKVEAQLAPENRQRARTRAVIFPSACGAHIAQELQIRSHYAKVLLPDGTRRW